MNHSYVIPAGYVQKSGFVTPPGAQVGPDANQLNVWALKFDPPSTVATQTPAANPAGWNQTDVTIALQAHDSAAGPGVNHITYQTAGAQTTPPTGIGGDAGSFQVSAEGTSAVTFFATGNGENVEAPKTLSVRIDKTAPAVTGAVTPAPNANGWIRTTPAMVTFACSDGLSGVAAGPPPPAVLAGEGTGLSVSGACMDAAGNVGSVTISNINIDVTPPSIVAPPNQVAVETIPGGAPVSYPAPSVSDSRSGVGSSSCLPASGSLFSVGTTTVTCSAADLAGNVSSKSFTVTVNAAPDGRMFGVGQIDDGGRRRHLVFRVSQLHFRDNGRLEYWANDARRCSGRDDDDDRNRDRDYDGDHDHNYGREHCDPADRFEATEITGAVFSDDPAFRPDHSRDRRPATDSVVFVGAGKWNGRSGYTFEVHATDQGEPGRHHDTFALVVKDSHGVVVGSVDGELDGGNIQSTRLR